MNSSKQLTTWEASCIISGYGIGAGVLSMPWLASRCGLPLSILILLLALLASYGLHIMIADLAIKSPGGSQLVACLEHFLFRGKHKRALTLTFFLMMALIFITNLAAYVSGAAEVLVDLLPLSPFAAKLLFYVAAASVVLLGLKAVGVFEKIAMAGIFILIAVLAAGSLLAEKQPLPLRCASPSAALAFYGMAMFALAAFFSVPQAVEGLGGDSRRIRRAVFQGLLNTFFINVVVIFFALLSSREVTEVAMVGWSGGVGEWARLVGCLFTVLAMLTTYWSLSLALADTVQEVLHPGKNLSWLLATLPSLLLVLFDLTGFMDLMRTAGGLIAIVISFMIIPTYRNACREVPGTLLPVSGRGTELAVLAAYLLMAVGSVVPVA